MAFIFIMLNISFFPFVDPFVYTAMIIQPFFMFRYEPGDVVMIQPENSTSAVEEFLQLLNLNRNKVVKISKRDNGIYLIFSLFILIRTSIGISFYFNSYFRQQQLNNK